MPATTNPTAIHADAANPHALQNGDQILVLVQQQDLSFAPAIRRVLDITVHDDGVQVRTLGGQQFFYRNGEYADRLSVVEAPADDTRVTVFADEVRKSLANLRTRAGFLKNSCSKSQAAQVESILIDVQVAEIALNNLTGEA